MSTKFQIGDEVYYYHPPDNHLITEYYGVVVERREGTPTDKIPILWKFVDMADQYIAYYPRYLQHKDDFAAWVRQARAENKRDSIRSKVYNPKRRTRRQAK